MAVNKIIYGNQTLLDLTGDTVAADKLLTGTTAHDKAGRAIEGTVVVQVFRHGTSEPDDSVGNNGDWYLVEEA